MSIRSDTIYYRADGTISSIIRRETVTFTGPKGETFDRDTEKTIELSDITDILDPAYASFDAHNKTLEAQIVTERETAATEKQEAIRQTAEAGERDKAAALRALEERHASELATKDAVIAQKADALSAKEAELTQARAAVVEAV